jgi:hypothetical protein
MWTGLLDQRIVRREGSYTTVVNIYNSISSKAVFNFSSGNKYDLHDLPVFQVRYEVVHEWTEDTPEWCPDWHGLVPCFLCSDGNSHGKDSRNKAGGSEFRYRNSAWCVKYRAKAIYLRLQARLPHLSSKLVRGGYQLRLMLRGLLHFAP